MELLLRDAPFNVSYVNTCMLKLVVSLKGTIRFIGPTKFKYGITWVGFELDKPVGKNSGWVKGKMRFIGPKRFVWR